MEHIIYRIATADTADAHGKESHGDSAHQAHESVPGGSHDADGEVNIAAIEGQMVIWTWVVFFVVAVVLYRVAWKPILAGLSDREEKIQRALDDARTAREQVEQIEATRETLIAEADAKAKEIVAEARQGAVAAAHVIETKAREEAQILLENAQREIRTSQEKAESALRQEMAEFAVLLSSKLVQENLDTPKNQALVSKLIEEL
jgi:F-type H+-transporting ATPase subunit b